MSDGKRDEPTAPTVDASDSGARPTPTPEDATRPMDSASFPAPRLGAGAVLAGRYRVDGVLGQGGFGAVFRARDLLVDRDVALKLLRTEGASGAERTRFLREARATGRLSHERIVALHDAGEAPEGLFLVLELVEGRALDVVLRDGKLLPESAASVARQIAEALAAAHAVGIVHRDVKPANVLIDGKGRVKVADFGIAQIAGETKLTSTGSLLGTPSYMAPEQVDGREVGPAADLFALGCVLHEMLTGRPPFRGKTHAEVLARIQRGSPEPLPDDVREASPELAGLLSRLLKKSPDARPAGAGTVARELEAIAAGRKDEGRVATGRIAMPRRRIAAVFVGVAIAVALVAIGAAVLLSPRTERPEELPYLLEPPPPGAVAPELPAQNPGAVASTTPISSPMPGADFGRRQPADGARIRLDWQDPPDLVLFRWDPIPGARRYLLRLGSTPGSGSVEPKSHGTSRPTIDLGLRPGRHTWSVTAFDETGTELASSSTYSLSAETKPTIKVSTSDSPPVVGKPRRADRLRPIHPRRGSLTSRQPSGYVRFEWASFAGAEHYVVEIRRDVSSEPPVEIRTLEPAAESVLGEPGSYTWKVRAIGRDGEILDESASTFRLVDR